MLPTKFRFIWPSGFRAEDFQKSANQKQELPVVVMCLLTDCDEMSNILTKGFQRKRLKCEKLTDDGRQVMAKAHIAFGKVS